MVYGGQYIGDIGCRPNRECGVWFEYPIVATDEYNSIDCETGMKF